MNKNLTKLENRIGFKLKIATQKVDMNELRQIQKINEQM